MPDVSASSLPRYAIVLENITKTFRGGRDVVLKGINLSFERGKLTYILGPSGTGKSVTIKHVLGLLTPDSGRVIVEGVDLSTLSAREQVKHRTRFGMLFQNAALFDDMTVFQNVAFPLIEHTDLSDAQIREKVERTLSLLDMSGGYEKYPNELSGGMKKRVGLARAIIREPSILLYDEPTTGLDPVTRITVDDLIAKLKRELKLTSVVISHDIPSALRLADRIAFLYGGHVVFDGTPQAFAASTHPEVRAFLDAEKQTMAALQAL